MGHYLMCRRYDVDATLPFFLPFPSLAGTLGAVIKIREPFPTRNALFDIAIGGPIGGFVVLVPLLFWGMHMSNVLPVPPNMDGLSLGEPLLFKLASWVTFGRLADGFSVNLHPIALAAWIGLLATAWNLLPFGQFDGGHLVHAVFGEVSKEITLVTAGFCVGICFVSPLSWVVMTSMMLVMLYVFGPRHPPVMSDYEPLSPGRRALALFALVMLVICFSPAPIARLR